MIDIYKNYQIEVDDIKKLRAEQTQFRANIQVYELKKNENEMVRKELDFIGENDIVYKLTGPLLVKEDISEAKQNVTKRVDFINSEM